MSLMRSKTGVEGDSCRLSPESGGGIGRGRSTMIESGIQAAERRAKYAVEFSSMGQAVKTHLTSTPSASGLADSVRFH